MSLVSRFCAPCRRRTCAKLAERRARVQRYINDAKFAGAVYDEPGGPPTALPPGFRRATDAELGELGLNRQFLTELKDPKTGKLLGFKSEVFVNPATNEKVVAFRGTTSATGDIRADVMQGLGFEKLYYTRAQEIAAAINSSGNAAGVRYTGHSLGGGLAAAASRASGLPATTFNAAGLHPLTILRGPEAHFANQIESVYVRGEILTEAQKALPILPEAASDFEYPLDPPENFGAQLWEKMKKLQIGDAAKAAAMRNADLHRMSSVTMSLNEELVRIDRDRIANGCP